jgi:aminoglycoside/choline kinase family phosphotransferase
MIDEARLKQITTLLADTPFKGAKLHPLAGDASFRRYVRVETPKAVAMLMDAPPQKEDVKPYIAVAEYLHALGFSAPGILARDVPAGLLLLEDLGDDSFTALLKRDAGLATELYSAAIDVVAQWHKSGFSNPDALAQPVYDEVMLLREVALLADWFLPQVMGKDRAAALKPEYMELWQEILDDAPLQTNMWVHRDYHADNLMWLPKRAGIKRVGLLDFQDGVYGDAAYDLVSLLEDARRDVPLPLASAMLARYIEMAGCDRERFMTAYAVLGAQRNSKIVGIFARLAARDKKPHYLNFLPRVWGHLEHDLGHPALAKLRRWTDLHIPHDYRGVIALSA